MKDKRNAIIIGAGIGGIASAIRLAVDGFEVSVYESNEYPGGKLSDLTLQDFHFDAGPSLFTMPSLIEELFELVNEPIETYFSYLKCKESCKYFFSDGTIVNAFTDKAKLSNELHDILGEDQNSVLKYLNQAETTYNNIGLIFLNYSLHKFSTLVKAPIINAFKYLYRGLLFGTLHHLNNNSFKNPKTIQIFDRYATFNGSNPYKAPGMLRMIPHLDNNIGTYYPKGGMISITNALYSLALKKGVKFYFNSPVQEIILVGKKVKGIKTNNQEYFSDVVVSNVDAYFTYKNLLNQPFKAFKILKQERSSSAFIFYWGIRKDFPTLGLHNIFFAEDYKAEFEVLFKSKSFYHDPTIYINITSKCEPGLQAPMGKENWFVMVNAPANIGQDWEDYYIKYKNAIILKLNRLLRTDLEPLIEVEEILTPVTIENKTKSYMGSLYGTSSNSKMAAFIRHPNFSKSITGLYFVGGSVHPGGGIPLCLQSAKIMAKMVSEDFKLYSTQQTFA